ncbi:MAG: SUMF1/EgtB/PvdO family nonheme iron enzyme [Planctomycetes bacterium]|nr:SUMF1/EgtB/PvdO family nonheme iron enzyme [Planctomycetota bacterium]
MGLVAALFRPVGFVLRPLRTKLGLGVALGLALTAGGWQANRATSSDAFCASCHVHPAADEGWKRSPHYDNGSGVHVHCIECHLPPEGLAYLTEKLRLGVRDAWTTRFGDPESIDWSTRGGLEHAATFTPKSACVACHANLFPLTLSEKGDEAHLHYSQHEAELECLACHLGVGHESKQETARRLAAANETSAEAATGELFTAAASPVRFENFRETLPGTRVAFDMVAIPGGEFALGTPDDESFRDADEGPTRRVRITRFWMSRAEVSWDEYLAFFAATKSEKRGSSSAKARAQGVDAITGATPPYGDPGQGWGKGTRPAITMTPHGAETYCRWLSSVTGKRYRLPTEAEWEYACRAGTTGAYFFGGEPSDFSERGFWNQLFGAEREPLAAFAWYSANSRGRTEPSAALQPNPFGLVGMLGNVAEICADVYAAEAYAVSPELEVLVDPRGPSEGAERVIRGGSYASDAADLRCGARAHTETDAWLKTDPQVPKSKWWYSDQRHVGFRVVCEVELADTR